MVTFILMIAVFSFIVAEEPSLDEQIPIKNEAPNFDAEMNEVPSIETADDSTVDAKEDSMNASSNSDSLEAYPDKGEMGELPKDHYEIKQTDHDVSVEMKKNDNDSINSDDALQVEIDSISLNENSTFSDTNLTVAKDGNITTTTLNTLENAEEVNATSNVTSSKPTIRWPCNPLSNSSIMKFLKRGNETMMTNFSSVLIINNETTLGHLISAMNRTKVCGLLLFYSPYCEFCTALAPLYNAVGRSFSDILIMAADAQNVMGISARYGIVGIPTVLFFHNGKAVAKYNRSTTAADFQYFILHLTGIVPTIPLNVTSDDRIGPLPSILKESRDYYLIFSICFLVFLFIKSLSPYLKHFTVKCFEGVKRILQREKQD